ncbi:protein MIS12 homolog isoform X1 [Apostichopus japonicus]|uniref:protein MIS12 homolog isoform X1 n=1 Tax=Stichopus japonicus TaxID=307972 RepID=UPI003AB4FF7C
MFEFSARMASNQGESSATGLHPLTDRKEYETQYFGFTPKSFVDGVYNAMVEYLSDFVEVTHKYFLDDERFKEQISVEALQESSNRLFVHLRDAFDKAFDRLENYLMKNIFHIPSGIVLPEDKVHMSDPVTESMDQKLDNELEELREKIRNAQYVNCRLQKWLQDVDSVQHVLDSLLAQLQKWQMVCRESNVTDLGETISFVADRTRQLLTQCNAMKATQAERNNNVKGSRYVPVKLQ